MVGRELDDKEVFAALHPELGDESALQAAYSAFRMSDYCLSRQSAAGAWRQDPSLSSLHQSSWASDQGWSWHAPASAGCAVLPMTAAAARSLLENRWILVVGDSRGRFLYSALSSLLEPGASRSVDPNGTWPHHWPNRTACPQSTPRGHCARTGSARNRCISCAHWYRTHTALGWFKGACREDWRKPMASGACTLDATAGSARVSFVWHSHNLVDAKRGLDGLRLWNETRRRLDGLQARGGGRAPDVVVLSTGAWDLSLSGSRWGDDALRLVKDGLNLALSELDGALNSAPLRVWYSSAACPRQAHSWPSQYETSGRNTSALYRATARRAGWTVLEVQRTHALLPPLRDSPCGARHPYGALAETHVSMLLSSLRV